MTACESSGSTKFSDQFLLLPSPLSNGFELGYTFQPPYYHQV